MKKPFANTEFQCEAIPRNIGDIKNSKSANDIEVENYSFTELHGYLALSAKPKFLIFLFRPFGKAK
jgi:hypothetical protein